jgi:predicted DNA-binding transcriptional regulator AlpA
MAKKSKPAEEISEATEKLLEGSTHARFISKGEVLERVCLTFPVIWQMIREKRFPAPRDVCGKALWIESDIEEWIKTRPAKKYKKLEAA